MDHHSQSLNKLLSRLEMVRAAGSGKWYARCPAHDDRSPSLSIRDTGTRTLIYCHAGCDASDILAALGLEWKDIVRDEWKATYGAACHQRVKLPPIDPLEHERRIIDLAESDLRAGRQLSIDDRARLEIALERVKGAA